MRSLRVRGDPPAVWALLIALCTASALMVVILGTRLTFFNDDWWFLLQRPGLESGGGLNTLLAPHNGNIVVLLALLYKLLVAIFGLGMQLPFRLLLGVTMGCLGLLVFVLVRDRLGPVVGLAAAAVILFLGPAWEVLLFFASFSHLGSLTLGIAALLVMEVDTPRRNAVACVLLVAATMLFNLGIPFVVAAAVVIALRRRPAQLWIAGVPGALFALWWGFYGSKHPSGVTLRNIEHLPGYVIDSISAGLTSVTGLSGTGFYHGSAASTLHRGDVLAAIVALAAVVWLLRGGRPTRSFLAMAAAALTFWLLTGAGYVPGREAGASRYQLTDAALLILLAAELLRGIALNRAVLAAICLAAALVVASNLDALRNGFDFMQDHAGYVKADLGALEVSGPSAPSGLWLLQPVARDPYLSGVTAGRYFAQVAAHGPPAYDTPAQLEVASPRYQQAADSVLAASYRLAPRPIGGAGSGKTGVGGCRRLEASAAPPDPSLPLTAGTVVVSNPSKAPLVIGMRRFAPSSLPNYVGFLAARSSAAMSIPRDSLARAWRINISNPSRAPGVAVTVCEHQ